MPTEIWRETVERRQRYKELSDKIEEGNIKSINDFIKYNLNIRKFAADILESTNDSKIIQIFYTALKEITILDPTCGSGAFLFAAMNILEPLYEICIDRMQYFIEKDGRGKHKKFEEILKEIKAPEHPNLEYYIYKNIILNNIFGVDIMNEAVEIAKLRLFLKLASLVEVDHSKRNMGLEPLPDIDFNIKSGNTLIGFPTIDEAVRIINEKDKPGQLGLNMSNEISVVNTLIDQTDDYAMIIKSYKSAQIKECYSTNKVIKEKINSKKDFINQTANKYLAFTYSGFNKKKNNYDKWVKTVKPFHWFSEFHDNVESGGFDVVIGNPPYVESKGVEYPTNGFKTAECGNLYAYVLERIKLVMKKNGYCGMIVPLSGHSTERMNNLVKYFYKEFNINYFFNISADANPSKIFEDVKFRLSIFIITNGDANIQVTKYRRWYSDERKNLFETIKYTRIGSNKLPGIIEKISADIHNSILEKILNKKINHTTGNKDFITYYHNAPVNWIRAHEFVPYFNSERDGTKLSTQLKPLGCDTEEIAKAMSAVLCSTLFYIWWITFSDCYHLNKSDIVRFKFNFGDLKIISELSLFYNKLKKDMLHNAKRRVYYYKNSGRVEYDEFYMKKSKPIIDEIDTILAKHYGFTEEELDFIINYDIKYRMGSELENEG